MRRDAREMTQKQQELSNKLEGEQAKEEKRKSLTDSDDKKEITEELGKQQEKLENLLQDMKEVVEKSELAEPLLNRKLYQTFREAHQDQTDKSLKASATLLEQQEQSLNNHELLRNLDEIMEKDPDKQKLIDQLRQRDFRQASKTLSDQSRRKMENLQKGVEKAAESVLGNEAQALKFAEAQLNRLSKALKEEKAEATGEKQEPQEGKGQAGNQKPRENEEGKGKPSESEQQAKGQGKQPNNNQQPQQGKPNEGKASQQEQQARVQGKQPNNQPNQPNPEAQGGKPSEQSQPQQNQKPNEQNQQAQQRGNQPQSGPASFLEKGFSRNERGRNPITGGDHREWTDRLRDVEEAVDRPELRDQVAQVREELRKMNSEFRRHSKEPEWDLLEKKILQPLDEIRSQIAEELAKTESDRALVPIDRDPVPSRYSDLVEKYYERLGKGK